MPRAAVSGKGECADGGSMLAPLLASTAFAAPDLELMAYREATRVPWAVRAGPLHPGVEGALRWPLTRTEVVRVDVTARAGAFHHRALTTAGTADVGLAVRRSWPRGPMIGTELALGGLLGRAPGREYVPDGQGGWAHDAARWRPAARVSLAVEAGFRVSRADPAGPGLFLRVRHWAEAPFSPGFIPAMVHRDVGVALQLPLGGRGGAS